jgi:hypothetical protein
MNYIIVLKTMIEKMLTGREIDIERCVKICVELLKKHGMLSVCTDLRSTCTYSVLLLMISSLSILIISVSISFHVL